jgi:hypothetical protein
MVTPAGRDRNPRGTFPPARIDRTRAADKQARSWWSSLSSASAELVFAPHLMTPNVGACRGGRSLTLTICNVWNEWRAFFVVSLGKTTMEMPDVDHGEIGARGCAGLGRCVCGSGERQRQERQRRIPRRSHGTRVWRGQSGLSPFHAIWRWRVCFRSWLPLPALPDLG